MKRQTTAPGASVPGAASDAAAPSVAASAATPATSLASWIARAVFFLILFCAAAPVFGDFLFFKIRNPMKDIAKTAGSRLTDEEEAIAGMVMSFFYVKYGYSKGEEPLKDAYKKMSDAEYAYSTGQAAKICKSDAAKVVYRMGKAGEKLLKAIIQTAEDAAKAAGTYIEKKSGEYDKKP